MRPWLKKTLIVFGALALLVIVLLAVGAAYLNTAAMRDRLLAMANAGIRGRLSLSGHHISLFSGKIVLSDLALADEAGRPIITIRSLEGRIVWPALARRTLQIADLRIDQSILDLRQDARGRLNLVQVLDLSEASPGPPEASRGPAWHVDLTGLQWELEKIFFQSAPSGLTLEIGGAQITGEADTRKVSADVALTVGRLAMQAPDLNAATADLKVKANYRGALDDPEAQVDLHINEGAVADIPLTRASVSARLAQREVTITSGNIQTPWGALELSGRLDLRPLFPHTLMNASGDPDGLTYSLTVSGTELIPRRVASLQFPLDGTWQGHLTLQGKGLQPDHIDAEMQAEVQVAGLQAFPQGSAANGRLTGSARWQAGRLRVSHLEAVLGDTRIEGAGELDTNLRTYAVEAALSSGRLAALGDFFDIFLPSGSAAATLSGRGTWQRPQAHLTLKAENLVMDDWYFGALDGIADLGPDGLIHLPRVSLRNRQGTIQGNGNLRLFAPDGEPVSDPAFTLNLDGRQLNWADFYAGLPLNAVIAAKLQATGTFARPTATLTLAPSPVRWQNLEVMAQGAAAWADGRLTLSDLRLAKGRSAAKIKARSVWQEAPEGPWRDDPLLEAELTAGARLEDFLPQGKGPLSISARIGGPASALQGNFQLDGREWFLRRQRLESVRVDGRLDDQTLQVTRLAAVLAPGQQLSGSGWYAFDRRFSASLNAENLDLRHLAVLQRAYPMDGRLHLQADAQGSLDHPKAQARVTVRNPLIDGKAWDDFRIEARLQERQLTLAAELTFQLQGNARTDTGRFELTAAFDNTDLAPYLALALDERWGGRLSGNLTAAGNWNTPKALRADLVLRDAHLNYQKSELIAVERLEMHMADGIVRLPQTRLTLLQDGYLTAAAVGRLDQELEATVDGRLPFAVVAPFTDSIERAGGELKIDARASGPWEAIDWQAEIEAVALSCIFTDLDQTLSQLNGRVRLTPRMLRVETLSGMLDDGRFTLDGEVQLASWQPTDFGLSFNAQALPLHWPDTMDLILGAELNLKGSARQAVLAGQVVVLEGSYYKDVRYDLLSLTRPRRAAPVTGGRPSPEWLQAVRLDVTVTHRYPFLVDNNLARLEIVPDLKLSGTAANPLLNGRAQVQSGEILFQGRSFTVQRGVVDFLNPRRIEPTLDILAKARIRQWLVMLALTGAPDNLLLKLSSDPPMSDANILSLILLGRPNTESAANTGQGAGSSKQMMASLLTSTLSEGIKERTGVDIFEMEAGPEEGGDSEDRVQLTVGKNLTPRLSIKYELETDNTERVQRAVSEYRLLENIVASGFQDTAGNYGGELIFRVQFR